MQFAQSDEFSKCSSALPWPQGRRRNKHQYLHLMPKMRKMDRLQPSRAARLALEVVQYGIKDVWQHKIAQIQSSGFLLSHVPLEAYSMMQRVQITSIQPRFSSGL